MNEILFVCTGNTCRSPMAEYLLRDLADKTALTGLAVSSAGLFAMNGGLASANACLALKLLGISLEAHRSRLIAEFMLAQAGFVLGMTREHKRELESRFPDYNAKFYTLGEFIQDPDLEIDDPFGGSELIYQRTAGQLQAAAGKILERIERMGRN